MSPRTYPTVQYHAKKEILTPLIPPAKSGRHLRTTDMREVYNAIY